MKYLVFVLLLIICCIPAMPAHAFDFDGYYGVITISNNGSSAASYVSANCSNINTNTLIDNGYLGASANDCAIHNTSGANITFMPGWSSNAWSIYVPTIAANSYINNILYTPNASGRITYFPSSTGMSISDNANMEPGDNFSCRLLDSFINTSASRVNENITSKEGALRIYVSGENEIGASLDDNWNLDYDLGVGEYCKKDAGVVSTWGEDFTTEVWFNAETLPGALMWLTSLGNSGSVNWTASTCIDANDKIWVRAYNEAGTAFSTDWISDNAISTNTWYLLTASYDAGATPELTVWVNNHLWSGTEVGTGGNATSANNFLSIGAVKGGAPYLNFFNGMIDEVRLSNNALTYDNHTEAWRSGRGRSFGSNSDTVSLWHFNEGTGNPSDTTGNNNLTRVNTPTWTLYETMLPPSGVFATGVTPGEYDLEVYADSANITIELDGAYYDSDSLRGLSAPDNANNWQVGSNSTNYIDLFNYYQGGVLTANLTWQYNSIFTDQSNGGNTGTPSFRTSSSNANVTANLTSFLPITEADAPPYSISDAPEFVSYVDNWTGNFTTTTNATIPGASVIEAISSATATPAQVPFTILAGLIIVGVSMLISWMMRQYGSASLVIKGFVIACITGVLVAVQWLDWWIIIFFIIGAMAVVQASQHRG